MDVANETQAKGFKATFCAIIWYLSNASLVFREASATLLPARSEAAKDGSEETPNSFKQKESHKFKKKKKRMTPSTKKQKQQKFFQPLHLRIPLGEVQRKQQ
jgi:hypothetical protein